jgi:hypothetical protein
MSLDELFGYGHVQVFNVGRDLIIINFKATHTGAMYRGEGRNLLAALANLKPAGMDL